MENNKTNKDLISGSQYYQKQIVKAVMRKEENLDGVISHFCTKQEKRYWNKLIEFMR